jgi:hypothetical protein
MIVSKVNKKYKEKRNSNKAIGKLVKKEIP